MPAMLLWLNLLLQDAPGRFKPSASFELVESGLTLEGITSGDATSLYQVLWANFGTRLLSQLHLTETRLQLLLTLLTMKALQSLTSFLLYRLQATRSQASP
jgi:hypothetical protein